MMLTELKPCCVHRPFASATYSPPVSTSGTHGPTKLSAPKLPGAAVVAPPAAVVPELAAVVAVLELDFDDELHASSKAGPASPRAAAPPRPRAPRRRKVRRSIG